MSGRPMANGRPRILVVDDDAVLQGIFCDALRALGYEADSAASGVEALQRLEAAAYDLIVTDLLMPAVDGWAVLAAARRAAPALPVVLISGIATEAAAERACRLGVPLLAKPFLLTEFQETVRRALTGEGREGWPCPPA